MRTPGLAAMTALAFLVGITTATGAAAQSIDSGASKADWQQLHPRTSPPIAFSGAPMAFDPELRQVVMYFPGRVDSPASSTWTWDGKRWHDLAIASPPWRDDATMAYDEAREQLVLVGGDADSYFYHDTWVFQDGAWTELAPVSTPPGGQGSTMAFDPISQRLILLAQAGTWAFDGTDWSQLDPAHQPLSRDFAHMTYDPDRHELVMFGGIHHRGYHQSTPDDTWAWTGTDWTELVVKRSPPGRGRFGMATVDGKPAVVAGKGYRHGETRLLNDVWVLGEHSWRRVSTTAPVSWSFGFTAAGDGTGLLFGGNQDGGWASGTWSLSR